MVGCLLSVGCCFVVCGLSFCVVCFVLFVVCCVFVVSCLGDRWLLFVVCRLMFDD